MTEWKEPKTDYDAEDQVTPNIFNDLGNNAKHLKEISCHVETQATNGASVTVGGLVFVEV